MTRAFFRSDRFDADCFHQASPHHHLTGHRWRPRLRVAARHCVWALFVGVVLNAAPVWCEEPKGELAAEVACTAPADAFESDLWAKVGETICLRCHTESGDAKESGFILIKPKSLADAEAISANGEAFWDQAIREEGNESVLVAKATGGLDHGGGQVIVPDSAAWQVLKRFVDRCRATDARRESVLAGEAKVAMAPLFEGVEMLSPTRLLRRITLSLAGRLPTAQEHVAVAAGGMDAIDPIVDAILCEPAFYDRLKEGFNDILLTVGIEDNAETILSYDHFEKTRLWYQKHDLGDVPEEKQERTRWELARVYRDALLREPYELIAHIVRNDLPFTEVVTADYIMVSPYTARGYGIYEELREKFKDPDDPFEYIPAKLKALTGRNGKTQESATGFYPHSGLLSTFHYLRRYPSTETNRNRLRSRMVYQHWLGVDVMATAPRSSDASAVAEKYAVPTMEAADCVICHKTVDPLAGLFQDYDFEGHVGPRKAGWYTDMFGAGFEGESLPADQRWRAPQWLGERIARDPRFAVAMVEHVYYILFGRKPMAPPMQIDDPYFYQRRCAYRGQRVMIESVATRFRDSNFNLKRVFKGLIESEFYRANGLSIDTADPAKLAALDDVGVVRLLSPEQLERKVGAVFGKRWGRLNESLEILYGGIDSIAVTERNPEPSGAMGAVQRMMANDVACEHVARDFRSPADQRLLFPAIELDVVPGSPEGEVKIRQAIVALHDRILGREDAADSEEVGRSYDLFCGILEEASRTKGIEPKESYFCGGREEFRSPDPHFTLRAWRAVVSYLLRRQEFLYE